MPSLAQARRGLALGAIAGLVAFFNERVDIEVDGEAEERPEHSPFAGSDWLKAHA